MKISTPAAVLVLCVVALAAGCGGVERREQRRLVGRPSGAPQHGGSS